MSAERVRPTLRAIRQEPMLVDDRLVAERLEARMSAETARWTRAWLVCWHAALLADDRFGRDEPWELPVLLDAVTVPKGGGDAARQREALEALSEVGVVATYDAGDGGASRRGTRTATLARDAFTSHAAALAVDWPTVVARSGAEPAALLVMRALAELIVPLDGWSAVPRRDLMLRTGYQHKQVRVALRRLVAADLLLAEGDVGTTARYRLTPRALGRAWSAEPAAAQVPTPVAAPVATPAPPLSAAAARQAAGQGVQLVIGGASVTIAPGASFEIGAGVAARVEIGPDGALRMVIQTPTS
jgi:hypothetical protein